jgi:hypothetical protein
MRIDPRTSSPKKKKKKNHAVRDSEIEAVPPKTRLALEFKAHGDSGSPRRPRMIAGGYVKVEQGEWGAFSWYPKS